MPNRTDLSPLPNAPISALLRQSPYGALPIIGPDGLEARAAYARPFPKEQRKPEIAIVVVGLGLSREATNAAINKLPPDISVSFSPYASDLEEWIRKARASGREVLLDLPLQPHNYPARDTGPDAILVSDKGDAATSKLEKLMGRAGGYIGFAGTLSSPVSAGQDWATLLRAIRNRGLAFVGDGLVGVPVADAPFYANVATVIDESAFRGAIDARLNRLELMAQRDGVAVAFVTPQPVSFERILAWHAGLASKGVELAPVSAVLRAPK